MKKRLRKKLGVKEFENKEKELGSSFISFNFADKLKSAFNSLVKGWNK